VAYVRQALGNLLNLPQEAQSRANGIVVGEDYEIRAGDTVEFFRAAGSKGVGALFPAKKLMTALGINEEQYQELLELGLPWFDLGGSCWHSEVAVDEWFRQGLPAQVDQRRSSRSGRLWCHDGSEQPPSSHRHGPLTGSQKQLVAWLLPNHKPDPRNLHKRAEYGIVWVRKNSGQEYEVWFRTQQEFAEANARRISQRNENGEK
jgi:hypothetical protein